MLTISGLYRRAPRRAYALTGRQWRQWLTYAMVGGSSTVVDLAAFNGALWVLASREAWAVALAGVIAALFSSLNSYAGHRRWTFQGAAQRPARLRTFLALNALTLLLNGLLALSFAWALPQIATLSALSAANLSKLLAGGGSGIVAFIGNKYWVFGARSAGTSL